MVLNDYLKLYFKEKNITQKKLETETGISQYKISLILNNKRKLTAEELMNIAIAFNINLENIKKEIKSSRQTNPWFPN